MLTSCDLTARQHSDFFHCLFREFAASYYTFWRRRTAGGKSRVRIRNVFCKYHRWCILTWDREDHIVHRSKLQQLLLHPRRRTPGDEHVRSMPSSDARTRITPLSQPSSHQWSGAKLPATLSTRVDTVVAEWKRKVNSLPGADEEDTSMERSRRRPTRCPWCLLMTSRTAVVI